jgi:hypothetical protein
MALGDFGVSVSPNTVARLLRQMAIPFASITRNVPPILAPTAMISFSI